jgi:hypothetical protein
MQFIHSEISGLKKKRKEEGRLSINQSQWPPSSKEKKKKRKKRMQKQQRFLFTKTLCIYMIDSSTLLISNKNSNQFSS